MQKILLLYMTVRKEVISPFLMEVPFHESKLTLIITINGKRLAIEFKAPCHEFVQI